MEIDPPSTAACEPHGIHMRAAPRSGAQNPTCGPHGPANGVPDQAMTNGRAISPTWGPHGIANGASGHAQSIGRGLANGVPDEAMREYPATANGVCGEIAGQAPPGGPLPMLASACPGWVCYAEKTHGDYVLPYISTTKSPQVSTFFKYGMTVQRLESLDNEYSQV
jgi:hypothetical protein